MNNVGIDCGMGVTNIDSESGIRYGIISQHSVSSWALSDMESDYGKPTCQECGNKLVEYNDDQHNEYAKTHGCVDYACETCHAAYEACDCYPDEALGIYIDTDTEQVVDCLDTDLMVIKSEYYTYAQYCSLCMPGAGNLDNPLSEDVGIKTYALGPDWFDSDNPCPYPIWRVVDNTRV